jgi:hypothetical protein
MAVHDVDMEHAASSGFKGSDFITQAGKISREDGWEDFDHDS